ncbi:hypothetical protein HKBW3S42_01397, partial [Candidatus Hakubella thermalkaliphila]
QENACCFVPSTRVIVTKLFAVSLARVSYVRYISHADCEKFLFSMVSRG